MSKLRILSLVFLLIIILSANNSCNKNTNKAPDKPLYPNPSNSELNVLPTNLKLKWLCTDPDNDILTFDVYLGNTEKPKLYKVGVTSNSCIIDSLKPLSKYYWKIVAKDENNHAVESNVWSFTTSKNKCVDIDGNRYDIVVIGSQQWMAEDLRVTHYPDGEAIPLVSDKITWLKLNDNNKDDAYCFYNNNDHIEYGALYTYAAAIGDDWEHDLKTNQGICPDGWHLPGEADWTELAQYLGGNKVAGGMMKITGFDYWQRPNYMATNQSGFSGLPTGNRNGYDGDFYGKGYNVFWWSATTKSFDKSWVRGLNYSSGELYRSNYDKSSGFPIRCVKD